MFQRIIIILLVVGLLVTLPHTMAEEGDVYTYLTVNDQLAETQTPVAVSLVVTNKYSEEIIVDVSVTYPNEIDVVSSIGFETVDDNNAHTTLKVSPNSTRNIVLFVTSQDTGDYPINYILTFYNKNGIAIGRRYLSTTVSFDERIDPTNIALDVEKMYSTEEFTMKEWVLLVSALINVFIIVVKARM